MSRWWRTLTVGKQMSKQEVGSSFMGKSAYGDGYVLVCLLHLVILASQWTVSGV